MTAGYTDIQLFAKCSQCPRYKAIIRLLFLGRCAAVEQLNQSLICWSPVSGIYKSVSMIAIGWCVLEQDTDSNYQLEWLHFGPHFSLWAPCAEREIKYSCGTNRYGIIIAMNNLSIFKAVCIQSSFPASSQQFNWLPLPPILRRTDVMLLLSNSRHNN